MNFFEELKRRNVFRVGIAYVVISWLLLQVTDIVVPILELPNWVDKLVLFLIMLGFPLVIFFAWAFELTPEGIKKERDVDRSQSVAPVTGRKLDRAIIIILVLALGWFSWDKFVRTAPESAAPNQAATETTAPVAMSSIKSIAVLPFVNMSGDAENEYFSDGISEEILNALAKVDDLKVAGRTSSFAFKGDNQDLRRIGEALGVAHILEGSVRKAGNTVRITAQLIQVEDGFHLWSETYDRELTNVFAIQDEIANAILTELKAELMAGESEALMADQTDPEAYQLYLRAKQHIYQRNRQAIEAAVAMLDSALEIDPNYAPALAQRGIATLLLMRRNYGTMTKEQAEPLAKTFFDRALIADPGSAEAWAGLGLYHSNRPRETRLGIEALEKALELNPNLINARNWLQSGYADQGDVRTSLTILEDMFERDPLYPPAHGNLVRAYISVGQPEKAMAVIARVEPYLPNDPGLLATKASTHISQGDCVAAMALLEAAFEQEPDNGTARFGYGLCLLATQQHEKLLSDFMPPWMRIFSLHATGRTEEATLAAYEQAASGGVAPLFALMNRQGRPQDLVQFFDDRWTSIEQFDAEYPTGFIGSPLLLELAYAWSKTGDQLRFDESMRRVREHHDALNEQGLQFVILQWNEAVYYALAGDEDTALDFIERAIDQGGTATPRMAWQMPAFVPLEGNPRYQALQQQMMEHINRQRVALGLEPVDA